MEVKMALYWDADKVPDHERKLEENPRLPTCLMWAGFAIGLGEITEENLKEWVYRLSRSTFEGRPQPDPWPEYLFGDFIRGSILIHKQRTPLEC